MTAAPPVADRPPAALSPVAVGKSAGRVALGLLWLAVVGFLVLGGVEAWRDSATYDEPVYVSSGLAGILHHDVADNAEHPPLFKLLAALPVLAAGPVIPRDGAWNQNNERTYSARFVQAQLHAGSLHRVTFASRLVPLLECALTALALDALATLLFGGWAGLLAGLLWLCNPLVLGIGHLDGVDIPFALTAVLVSLTLVRWLRRPDRRSLLWLGAACGAAVSAQSTGFLLAALAVLVVVLTQRRRGERWWPACRATIWLVVVAWLVVWAPYIAIDPAVVIHSWVILPQPYVEGLRFLATHDTGAAPGFLLGIQWTGASVWFWPATLLVKLTAPVLVAFVVGPLVLVALTRSGRISWSLARQAVVAVAIPAVILFAFELPNPRTLGARYLLPSIALWAVMASPVALLVGRRAVAAALALVVGAAGALTAASFPESIAATSAPFVPGYRVATDSNVDWGQDFSLLTRWSSARHPYVAYFGPRGLTVADVPGARPLLGVPPDRIMGWVAASASDLTSADRSSLSWLRAYCPVGTLGGSILLYRFASHPSAVPGPVAPAATCRGQISKRVGGGGERPS